MSISSSHSWQEIAISSAGHECWFFINFHHMKIKTVYSVLVTIASFGYPYIIIDRNLTKNHNSWTADGMAICCLCPFHLFNLSISCLHYSINRIVLSGLCLNYSHINGLSVIQYLFNQSLFLFHNLVPLSLLAGKSAIFLSCQQSVSW